MIFGHFKAMICHGDCTFAALQTVGGSRQVIRLASAAASQYDGLTKWASQ